MAEQRIFSFDAETDGLWGEPWALGAVVLDEQDRLLDRFAGQIDATVVTDPWVRENIVPVVELPLFNSQEDLLNAFWAFWLTHSSALCVADFGSAVEAYVVRKCVALDPETRTWDGPYPMHELGTALLMAGIDPDINRREMCERPDLIQHDPVDDALAAGLCWNIATRRLAAVTTERDHLKARFCPSGLHYRPSTLNLATGELDPSRCEQCDHDQRVAECAHGGGLSMNRVGWGWRWACAQCGHGFGMLGYNLPKDEAIKVIRAALAGGGSAQ